MRNTSQKYALDGALPQSSNKAIGIDQLPMPAMLLDQQLEVIACNAALRKLLEKPVTLDDLEFWPLAPEDLGAWLINQPDGRSRLRDAMHNQWYCHIEKLDEGRHLLILQPVSGLTSPGQQANIPGSYPLGEFSTRLLRMISGGAVIELPLRSLLAEIDEEVQSLQLSGGILVAVFNGELAGYAYPYLADVFESRLGNPSEVERFVDLVRTKNRRIHTHSISAAGEAGHPPARLDGSVSFLNGFPIRSEGKVIGVLLSAETDNHGRDSEWTLQVLELLSDLLGIIISRHESSRRLRESTEQYINIVSHFEDGLCVIDGNGLVRYANAALGQMLALSSDISGRHLRDILSHNERFKFEIYLGRICRGEQLSFELSIPGIGVDDRNLLVSAGPCGEMDNQSCFFLHFSDISSLRHAETEKMHLMEQILSSRHLERLGTFAGGISHEFNNILQVIRANAELAILSGDEASQAALREIVQGTARAGNLVQQLLIFSRQKKVERVERRLSELVTETIRDGFCESQQEMLDLELDFGDDRVVVDEMQVRELLRVLIDNALQSLREGGRVRIRLLAAQPELQERIANRSSNSGSCMLLQVEDDGEGIRGEDIDRIFDPFFTTRRVGQGLGMGLSMAHGIVMAHNGAIWASPARSGGTTFNVLLESVSAPRAAGEHTALQVLPKVLLVDDEEILLRLGRRLLTRIGMHVVSSSDSTEAAALLREHAEDFSLLITDMHLPGADGLELARLARRLNPAIQVILCTGYLSDLDDAATRQAGIECVMAKPFEIHELSRMVLKLLPHMAATVEEGRRRP